MRKGKSLEPFEQKQALESAILSSLANLRFSDFKPGLPGKILSPRGTSMQHAARIVGRWERQIKSARGILAASLKKHGESLNDESLRRLLVEIEEIINSKPITCDNIGDVNSVVPLNPMQLLSMKTKIVMPLPGIFQKEDMYCRKNWQRVQHVRNGFWTRWKKSEDCSLLHCSLARNGTAQNEIFKLGK